MRRFDSGLFDKLMAADGSAGASCVRLSLDEVKEIVARDLEALLNSRCILADEHLSAFPEARRSIVTYGLRDFSGLSLASARDRALICHALQDAVMRHEPRLRNVRATLDVDERNPNALRFSISALLVVQPMAEPVNFDALLQPNNLRYVVMHSRRMAA